MSERNNDTGRLWGLRAVALALAVGLWFGISLSNREPVATKVVEATVSYLQPGDLVLIKPPTSVEVTVSGPQSVVRTLLSDLVDVQVDLRGRAPGAVNVSLTAEQVTLPHPGLSVDSIAPNVLPLDLDRSMTRKVELRASHIGEPAAGARVLRDQIRVEPPEATVVGPARIVEKLEKLDLTPIDLSGRAAERLTEQATVLSPDPLVHIEGPTQVKVIIPMDLGTTPQPSGSLEQGL